MFGENFEWSNNQQEIAEEGLTPHDKNRYISLITITSIIGLLIIGPIVYCGIQYQAYFSNIFFYSSIISCSSAALTCIFAALWANTNLKKPLNSLFQNQVEEKKNILAIIVFFLSSVQLILNISFLIYMIVEHNYSIDYFKAQHGVDQINNLYQQFGYYLEVGSFCIGVQIICLGTFQYATYVSVLTQFDVKMLINIYNLLLVFTNLLIIYSTKIQQSYFKIPTLGLYASQNIQDIAIYSSYICIGFSLIVFAINCCNSKINYLIIGSILLIIITIFSGINHEIITQAKNIRKGYIQYCTHIELQQCPQSWLALHKCSKYLTITVQGRQIYDMTSCPQDFITYVWEPDVGQTNQLNQQACLNLNCCNVLADSYSIWFMRGAFFTFLQICVGFWLAMVCYFLSQKDKLLQQSILQIFHIIFFILLVALISGGYYFINIQSTYPGPNIQFHNQGQSYLEITSNDLLNIQTQQSNSQQKSAQFTHEHHTIDYLNHNKKQFSEIKQIHNQQQTPQASQQNFQPSNLQDCIPVSKLLEAPLNIQLQCDSSYTCTSSTGVRLSLSNLGGNFVFDINQQNKNNIFIFSQEQSQQLLPQTAQSHASILVQGNVQEINDFVNNMLIICGCNILNPPQISIINYQVELIYSSSDTQQQQQQQQVHQKKQLKKHTKLIDNSLKSQKFSENSPFFKFYNKKYITHLDDLLSCQQNLQNVKQTYLTKCAGAQGNYQNQIGNFYTQTIVDFVSFSQKQTISGSVTTQDNCNLLSNTPLAGVAVALTMLDYDTNQQKQISSVNTDAKGNFQFQIPFFTNSLQYFASLLISKDQFLTNNLTVLLGGGNSNIPLAINPINMVSLTGSPFVSHTTCPQPSTHQLKQKSIQFHHDPSLPKGHTRFLQQTQSTQQLQQNLADCQQITKQLSTCPPPPAAPPKAQASTAHKDVLSQFTDQQKTALDKAVFQNLQLISYDLFSKKRVSASIVQVFRGTLSCTSEQQNLTTLIFSGKTDETGSILFNNLISGPYTVQAIKQGYFSYCQNFVTLQTQDIQLIRLALSPDSKQIGSGVVVLEHDNKGLKASLSLKQDQCLLNYVNQECTGIQFAYNDLMNIELGQAIQFQQLDSSYYLFFVSSAVTTLKQKQILEYIQGGISVSVTELQQNFDNTPFFTGNLRIKLYVGGRKFQVAEYTIPAPTSQDQFYNPLFNWLAICIDGSLGLLSQRQVNHLWEQIPQNSAQQQQFWQYTQGNSPNNNICQQYFNEQPFL